MIFRRKRERIRVHECIEGERSSVRRTGDRQKQVAFVIAAGFAVTWLPLASVSGVTAMASTSIPTTTINGQTYYEVSTSKQLEYIDENQSSYLSSNIELLNSIDLSTSGSNYLWTPLGNSTTPYTGTFNGNGHVVSGWSVNAAVQYAGFFGAIKTGSIIESVGVRGNVTGENASGSIGGYTGGLVGYQNGGSITNSYATGNVTGENATGYGSGGGPAGGLVGKQNGGSITNSYATGNVTGGNATGTSGVGGYAGGLIGQQMFGSISTSFATGTVKGGTASGENSEGGSAGALVGMEMYSTITNSYATGTVTGGSASNNYSASPSTGGNAGGLVGYGFLGTIKMSFATGKVMGGATSGPSSQGGDAGGLVGYGNSDTIKTSYATGQVTGGTASGASSQAGKAGGFVGANVSGTIASSYFDTDTTNQTAGVRGATLTGVTRERNTAMQTQSTFSSWDFTKTWAISLSKNGGYPYLQGLPPVEDVPVLAATITSGTKSSTVVVSGTPNTSGDTLYYMVTSTKQAVPLLNLYAYSGITKNTLSTASIPVSDGDYVGVYEVTSQDEVVAFRQFRLQTVSFDSHGGSTVASESVQYNNAATKPADPTRTGYTFDGWYTDSGLTQAYDFTTPITTPVTLHAKWTANSYGLTLNDENGATPQTQKADFNTMVTLPSAPTKTGYTFVGWNTKADGSGTSHPAGSRFSMPAKNVTLYAHWIVNPSISSSAMLPSVLQGTSYQQTLQAIGGVSPYSFSVSSGSLPTGLALTSDGTLKGTPTQSGDFTFTVQVKDQNNVIATRNMSLYVIPAAPAGYLKTIEAENIVSNDGGTLQASNNGTTATLVVLDGTFSNALQMDVTAGTVPSNLIPSGWNLVAAYGVNFDSSFTPAHPLTLTLRNSRITSNSKVYKLVNGKLVPVTPTVTQDKVVISFTTDPAFVVVTPKPVAKATTPSTGFPAYPWAAGGFLAVLLGGVLVWWRRIVKR